MLLKLDKDHKKALVEILARYAGNPLGAGPKVFFQNLVASANLPPQWILQTVGGWTGFPKIDALSLIDWAIIKRTNTVDPRYTTLGSILEAFLQQEPSLEDSLTIATILIVYNLIRDEVLLDKIREHYMIPWVDNSTIGEAEGYWPSFEWRGPELEEELQAFFSSASNWHDMGFLQQGVARAKSVCCVETDLNSGTGFLIAPTLILTNYHVLVPNEKFDIQGQVQKTTLRFGFIAASNGDIPDGRTFKAKQIVRYSKVEELDYVLLEVESDIQSEESIEPAPLELNLPRTKSPLNIIHHPRGDVMKLSTSENGVTGVYKEKGLVQYVTRAASGSSGSPCFNNTWKVVALHHAQKARAWGTVREGILIHSIYEQICQYL